MKNFLKMDDEAREICKPHGCRVTGCLKKYGMADCGTLMAILNTCIDDAKKTLAPKYGLTENDYKW